MFLIPIHLFIGESSDSMLRYTLIITAVLHAHNGIRILLHDYIRKKTLLKLTDVTILLLTVITLFAGFLRP